MERRRICWNITSRCNQNCKYCHRFLDVQDLTYEENEKILENLIKDGVSDITWTGGEALLYPNIEKLMENAKAKGIKNKLITNGKILAQNEGTRQVLNYLDGLTLSLDTIEEKTNEELGRGREHFQEVKVVLDYIKNNDLPIDININTVVNRKNIGEIEELGEFLNNYSIRKWKFFKFMPLRETAVKNRTEFAITDEEFEAMKSVFRHFKNIKETDFRKEKDMEEKYTLITANGNIIKTENGKDRIKGNAMFQNVVDFMGQSPKKTRVVISHSDENIANDILQIVNNLDYAEVVGIANNGEETYNKIIDLKPDVVFSKYYLEGMNGLELLKSSKERLEDRMPRFNMIIDNRITEDEVNQMYEIVGNKINALVTNPVSDDVLSIMKEYKK